MDKHLTTVVTFTYSHTHTHILIAEATMQCIFITASSQLLIRSNLGFSVLLKDTLKRIQGSRGIEPATLLNPYCRASKLTHR